MPNHLNFLYDMLTGQEDMRKAPDIFDSLTYVILFMWMAVLQINLGNVVLIKGS